MTKFSKTIIADSSGIISLFHSDDKNHKKAIKIKNQFNGSKGLFLVPSEVLSETLNIVGKKISHEAAIKIYELISEICEIVPSDKNTLDAALEIFKSQNKQTSFTDCIVMALADQYETKYIFGFDEVFEKSGYPPA